MKHLKRFFSVLLTLAVLFTCLTPAALAVDDITGHWAEPYLREMNAHGVINPNGSGSYTPNSVISRAEFMRYVNRAYGFTQKADISKYTDVASSKWYYETVQIAVRYGYISGTGDTTMSPDRPITREQVCAILGRLSKKDYAAASADSLPFTDSNAISNWCLPYVSAMVEDNVLVGDDYNRFRPKASVTRGEIARMLYAYLGSQLDKNAIFAASDLRSDAANATISASCILQNATVAGDLYISEGLSASSNITLRNVSVLGTLVVAGGSVTLENVQCENLLVSSPFGTRLTITATNGTEIETTLAKTEAALTADAGSTFGKVTGATPGATPGAPSTSSAVTPASASLDRNPASDGYNDLVFTLTPAPGAALQYLTLGNTVLQETADYTYDAATGKVTLPAGRAASKNAGSVVLTFVMSAGENPTVSIQITDSTPTASISPNQMVFSATEGAVYYRDVTVWLDLAEGETVSRVLAGSATLTPGEDFLTFDNRVVLFRESLAKLAPAGTGTVDLVFALSGGASPTLRLSYI